MFCAQQNRDVLPPDPALERKITAYLSNEDRVQLTTMKSSGSKAWNFNHSVRKDKLPALTDTDLFPSRELLCMIATAYAVC